MTPLYPCTAGVRPNAFIAVRVASWRIRDKVQQVQEQMVKEEPLLQSSMVSLDKLHLTLMVLKLDSEKEEERYGTVVYPQFFILI